MAIPVHHGYGIACLHTCIGEDIGKLAHAFVEGGIIHSEQISVYNFALWIVTNGLRKEGFD